MQSDDDKDETGPEASRDGLANVTKPILSGRANALPVCRSSALEAGMPLCYLPTTARAVRLQACRVKGSDASNWHDEEPAAWEVEFSDDEEEARARKARKNAKKRVRDTAGDGMVQRPPRQAGSSSVAGASSDAANDTGAGRASRRKQKKAADKARPLDYGPAFYKPGTGPAAMGVGMQATRPDAGSGQRWSSSMGGRGVIPGTQSMYGVPQ